MIIEPANVSDAILTEKTINNSKISLRKKIICADKGYINHEVKTKLRNKYGINFIYPYRKNQKTNFNHKKKNTKNQKVIVRFVLDVNTAFICEFNRVADNVQ